MTHLTVQKRNQPAANKMSTNNAPDAAIPSSPKLGEKLSTMYDRALATSLRDANSKNTTLEEYSLAKVKERLLRDWHPEYEPEFILPPQEARGDTTVSERATRIQLQDIVVKSALTRKTKIVCTLGPACGTKTMLAKLIDAGLNIARLNFSHGEHVSHAQMLQLFRYDDEVATYKTPPLIEAFKNKVFVHIFHVRCPSTREIIPRSCAGLRILFTFII